MTSNHEMASIALASLQDDANYSSFVAARWHEVYELGQPPHEFWLSLYCTAPYDAPYGSRISHDSPDSTLDLCVSSFTGDNKRFAEALKEQLAFEWQYPSEQKNLGFNKTGAYDMSASFDFAELKQALLLLANGNTVSQVMPLATSQSGIITSEAQLEDVLRAHYDSLADDDDMTIYFICDLDEDWSSADDEMYKYTGHCVSDSNYDPIAYMTEGVFDLCHEGEFVGDIETQMYEVSLEVWLGNRPQPIKALSTQQQVP